MQQEKISFITADDFPVYEGHPLTLWYNKEGKPEGVISDKTEVDKKDLFFLRTECTKLDITKCEAGEFLQWTRDIDYELSNAKIKFKKDGKVIFVGAEPDYFVVVDVETKKNINLTRSDARLNLTSGK